MAGLVLDASAMLAVLRDEPGAAMVTDALDDAWMSTVNYAEVISYYAKLGAAREAIEEALRPLPIRYVEATADLAIGAGMLRAATAKAGLSLGDRFCLALAKARQLPAMTADKTWKAVADAVGVKVILIR